MTEDVLVASEALLRKLDSVDKFGNRYGVHPQREITNVMDRMRDLAKGIPDLERPESVDDLVLTELKRRLNGQAAHLEQMTGGKHYDFDTVVDMCGVPREDIAALGGWLRENRDETLDVIERLYKNNVIENFELGLPMDIPSVRRQAEEFVGVHVQRYHRVLGRLLEDLTKVGGFLRDVEAVPTSNPRSYFHSMTNRLALGIPAVCFTTEDGSLQLRERELITLYGHEGMGHALNEVVTDRNGLPHFLKESSPQTVATAESIAQFYQERIFEDLKESPETQKALGIAHKFGQIYQEASDIARLNDFKMRLYQHSIAVLANKSLGEPKDPATMQRKVEMLGEVTLDPSFPLSFVEGNRDNFDSQGNLSPKLVGELRYCARPVDRALDEFARQGVEYDSEGRDRIDATFLNGYWTPQGFVDNARLRAVA